LLERLWREFAGESVIEINLLKTSTIQNGRRSFRPRISGSFPLIVLFTIVFGVILGGYFWTESQLDAQRLDLEKMVQKLKVYQDQKVELSQYQVLLNESKKLNALISDRRVLLQSLLSQKTINGLLLPIFQQTSENLYLERIEVIEQEGFIEGKAADFSILTDYETGLRKSGTFESIKLEESQEDPNLRMVSFQLKIRKKLDEEVADYLGLPLKSLGASGSVSGVHSINPESGSR
jgi:hypothetical protein